MTSPAISLGTAGTLLRVSITTDDRRLDVGVPAALPLAELLPGFARALGELDAVLVYGGYRLRRTDGTILDPDTSMLAQGITDGELLTLMVGAEDRAPRVYDDVVEAVGDAVEGQHSPWTATDSARTALAAAATFLLGSSILLLGASDSAFAVLVAGVSGVLVLAAAAVLDRTGQPSAARVLALTSTAFGAVAGYLLADSTYDFWSWPLAFASLGVAAAGFLGLLVLRERREVCVTPIASGLVLALAGSLTALLDADPAAVLALTMAICVTLGNGIPWLAISSSRIRVITPLSDAEIFDAPDPIDRSDIGSRYDAGRRLILVLRAAVAIVALVSTPQVTSSGIAGAVLCALCFLGMMVSTRQTFTRADVLTVMGTGIAGLLLTGLVAVTAHPEWRAPLIIVLGATAAITVAVALLSDKPHVGLGRIADGVDLMALALLLPLGVVVAGLV